MIYKIRIAIMLTLGALAATWASAFPEGAIKPLAKEITEHVTDKVFTAALKDGTSWRIQYLGNTIYIDVSTGFKAVGEWRTEDGSICTHFKGSNPSCNDVRFFDGSMYLRRANGEILRYTPK